MTEGTTRELAHQGLTDADACALSKELATNKTLTSIDLRSTLLTSAVRMISNAAAQPSYSMQHHSWDCFIAAAPAQESTQCAQCSGTRLSHVLLHVALQVKRLNGGTASTRCCKHAYQGLPCQHSLTLPAAQCNPELQQDPAHGQDQPNPRQPHLPVLACPHEQHRQHQQQGQQPHAPSRTQAAPPHAASGEAVHNAQPCPPAAQVDHLGAAAEAPAGQPCSHRIAQPPQQQQQQRQPQDASTTDRRLQRLEEMGGLAASQISELQRLLHALDISISASGSSSSSKGAGAPCSGGAPPASNQVGTPMCESQQYDIQQFDVQQSTPVRHSRTEGYDGSPLTWLTWHTLDCILAAALQRASSASRYSPAASGHGGTE
eukprot:1160624-Pelagomonas_calceolata.AAC.3